MKYYQIKELSNFDSFRQVTVVRDHIIKHADNPESRVAEVSDYIIKQWLSVSSFARGSVMSELIRMGYSLEEISIALAEAWINDRETIVLPSKSLVQRWGKSKIALLISVSFVFTLTLSYSLFLFHQDHELFSYLVWVIGLPSAVLSWLVYEGVMFFWRGN